MVHQFKNNGYDIVLDVNSGAIHVVDDVTYDVIAMFEEHTPDEIVQQLKDQYPEAEIKEAIDEVEQLKQKEELFTEDVYKSHILDFKKRPTVVKALWNWEWQKPYNRWTWSLDFKYFGNIWWGGGTENGVNLVDNTGKICQNGDGDFTWKESNNA